METYPSIGVPKEYVFLHESARAWGHPTMNYFGGNDFSKWQGKLLWKYECVFHWGVLQGRTERSWCRSNSPVFFFTLLGMKALQSMRGTLRKASAFGLYKLHESVPMHRWKGGLKEEGTKEELLKTVTVSFPNKLVNHA